MFLDLFGSKASIDFWGRQEKPSSNPRLCWAKMTWWRLHLSGPGLHGCTGNFYNMSYWNSNVGLVFLTQTRCIYVRHVIVYKYCTYIYVELFLAAGTSSTHGPKHIFAAQAQPNLAAWETAVERQTSNSRLEFGGATAASKKTYGDGSVRPSLLQKPMNTPT